jgi:hypothetical protein
MTGVFLLLGVVAYRSQSISAPRYALSSRFAKEEKAGWMGERKCLLCYCTPTFDEVTAGNRARIQEGHGPVKRH